MRRLSMVLVVALAAVVWPAIGFAQAPLAAQAAGGLQADFNNDGFIDTAVGVPLENIGTVADAGAISVLYGSAGGLTSAGTKGLWQGSGGAAGTLEAGDQFGSALAAGDFNNNGTDDLAVAAPEEDIAGVPNAGAVSVLYGAVSGLTSAGTQGFWQGAGGAAGTLEIDIFGSALAAEDFDNDGFADLAVGARCESIGAANCAGAVDVLYGSSGGLTSAGSRAFWQGSGGAAGTAEDGDQFGSSLAAGDFDNDGFADLAFEDIGAAFDAGAVNVLYGSAAGLTGSGSQAFWQGKSGVLDSPGIFELFGFALAAGDFNNNGTADLAIGTLFEDIGGVPAAGAVNVLYGSAAGVTGSGSQLFWQDAAGVVGTAEVDDLFGSAVSAGDFNNNGTADLAVGVRGESIGTVADAGAVNVLYGSAGGLTGTGSQLFSQDTPGVAGTTEAGDRFGAALAGATFIQ